MCPHRGVLWVKWTLQCLQLSSINGQPNTPAFCVVEWIKNIHVHCEDWCMHCYQIVNTPSAILDQVGTSRNRSLIWSAGSGYIFLPLLTGPLFLNRGGSGTPQGKILVRTLCRVCAVSSVPWLHYHSCIITERKKSLTLYYLLLVVCRIKIICHGII